MNSMLSLTNRNLKSVVRLLAPNTIYICFNYCQSFNSFQAVVREQQWFFMSGKKGDFEEFSPFHSIYEPILIKQ